MKYFSFTHFHSFASHFLLGFKRHMPPGTTVPRSVRRGFYFISHLYMIFTTQWHGGPPWASDQLSARVSFETTQTFKQYTNFTHKIIPERYLDTTAVDQNVNFKYKLLFLIFGWYAVLLVFLLHIISYRVDLNSHIWALEYILIRNKYSKFVTYRDILIYLFLWNEIGRLTTLNITNINQRKRDITLQSSARDYFT